MNLRSEVIAESLRLVEQSGHTTHEQLVAHARTTFADRLLAEVGESAINTWLSKSIRSGMSEALPKDAAAQQPSFAAVLPGFPVPAVISTQEGPDEEVTYIAFGDAVWQDLDGHEAMLTDNIVNAQRNLYDFKDKRDVLRPYMQPYPRRTVTQSLAMLAAKTPADQPPFEPEAHK